MNTNRDSSQLTILNRAKTLAAYHAGNVRLVPGTYSDTSSTTYTQIVLGQGKCCSTETSLHDTTSSPTYTTYYSAFTTAGSSTWTAPATIQSPITYWIVGGGGGGAGAYDQRGNGGGGGGFATTGTYAVVAGTTYSIVVGAGGAGGTGQGTLTLSGPFGSHSDGEDGTDSSFDSAGGGPVAAGGGRGLIAGISRSGGTGGTVTTGGGGGGGGGSGGGGGGAGGDGTAGTTNVAGIGGTGISFTISGYNGGNAQVYGAGGNGGANSGGGYAVGVSGSANTGNGGQGGRAASFQPPYAGGVITMGGAGGSGLVVIQYSA